MKKVKKPSAIIAAALAAVMALDFTGCSKVPDPGEVIVYSPSISETDVSAFSYYYDSDLNGMVVDNYHNQSPKVRIPDTIEGEPVTGVVMPHCKKTDATCFAGNGQTH